MNTYQVYLVGLGMQRMEITSVEPQRVKKRLDDLRPYKSLVDKVVKFFEYKYPYPVLYPHEEKEADAYIGLWKAQETHHPERGLSFERYASYRMHYQMLDELRNKIRQLQRRPKEYSIENIFEVEEEINNYKDLFAGNEEDYLTQVQRRERFEELIAPLRPKTREMFRMYYADGLTMREVGEKMSLTLSRICQIMHGAILTLQHRRGIL